MKILYTLIILLISVSIYGQTEISRTNLNLSTVSYSGEGFEDKYGGRTTHKYKVIVDRQYVKVYLFDETFQEYSLIGFEMTTDIYEVKNPKGDNGLVYEFENGYLFIDDENLEITCHFPNYNNFNLGWKNSKLKL